MKRILTVFVVLGFVIGMTACAGKKAEEPEIIEDDMEMPEHWDDPEANEPEVVETVVEATPKKTTVKTTVEVVEEVKEEAPKRRGGGTSGN
jgi:hypothetical protein